MTASTEHWPPPAACPRLANRRAAGLATLLLVAILLLGSAHAVAVEANRASAADLVAIKGLGPVLVERIVAARQQRHFADWNDFSQRVRGVGPATAARLSANGLTVNGQSLRPSTPTAPQRWQPMLPQPLEAVPR